MTNNTRLFRSMKASIIPLAIYFALLFVPVLLLFTNFLNVINSLTFTLSFSIFAVMYLKFFSGLEYKFMAICGFVGIFFGSILVHILWFIYH
ncbi:MAG: hypothetical protein COB92_04310 [Robiginitomaculum sp.]|nr:MAG: hypothetical protein COB92_08385 [Robiginitomaculum sp.]PHQ67377.1 MAG: hypothetical protein COB92_04310 [Robiginitomaculum sp.]